MASNPKTPIKLFSGHTIDSIYILDRLRPVFWRGIYVPEGHLSLNKAQEEIGYSGSLPVKWRPMLPGFFDQNILWTFFVGFEELDIDDPDDPPVRKEVRDIWVAIDGAGTTRRTNDRGKTWSDPVERTAPWAVPYGSNIIAIDKIRAIVPGVYNLDYPLSNPTNWGPNVIAGYCPGTANPLYYNPLQTFADMVSTVYLGDEEVIYSDYITVGLSTSMSWAFTDYTSHLPGTTNGRHDPGNGNLYEFNNCGGAPAPPPGGQPNSCHESSKSRGISYTYYGPAPTFNSENGILSSYEGTRIYSQIGCTDLTRTTNSDWYWCRQIPWGASAPDVPEYGWNNNFQTYTIGHGFMDSIKRIYETMLGLIEQGAATYVADGGSKTSGGALVPGSGTAQTGYPNHYGPRCTAYVNLTVWGRIQGDKVIPTKAKVAGWELSSSDMGCHMFSSATGAPPATNKDEHGRRCTIYYPKMYLGNNTILGICRMGRITVGADTEVDVAEQQTPYGYANSNSYGGGYAPMDCPPLPPVPYGIPPIAYVRADSSNNISTGRYWDDWVVSKDNGETWGPGLTIGGNLIGQDLGYSILANFVKCLGNGKAVIVMDGGLYEIDSKNAEPGQAELKPIPQVEDATWVNAQDEVVPHPITMLVSTMRSPDQFMFEIYGMNGYTLILSYDSGEHMILVDEQEPEEAGLFPPPRPYWVPTFAGEGLDSHPVDKSWPYFPPGPELVTLLDTTLPDGTLGYRYSHTLSVTGGDSPYSFRISKDKLPDGLVISPDFGYIEGYPSKVGAYNFEIEVKDSTVLTPLEIFEKSTKNITKKEMRILVIELVPEPLEIYVDSTMGIEIAKVNYLYSCQFKARGGNMPYTFAGADLAGWMYVDPVTGLLSGLPLYSGSWSVKITVTDSSIPPVSVTNAYLVQAREDG